MCQQPKEEMDLRWNFYIPYIMNMHRKNSFEVDHNIHRFNGEHTI
jgi:hypothetical protein